MGGSSHRDPEDETFISLPSFPAAYCVMTYILGVGDRHLDNLLLKRDGALFHVDFAYLLGQEPKILPPPMKLTKEMVEGMGGPGSTGFRKFRQYCHTAYLVIRR